MTKRLIGRVAVRFYPREMRDSRGEEILGTALDAGDVSLTAFVWQAASLIAGGLGARSRRAFGQPSGKLAASALYWGAITAAIRIPVGQGVSRLAGPPGPAVPLVTIRDMYLLPLVMLASFTLGRHRLAGLLGLAWVALYARMWGDAGLSTGQLIDSVLLPGAGFGVLALRPRVAPPAWQARSLWLLSAAALALVHVASPLPIGPHGSILVVIPGLLALASLPLAPAFAVGTALAWSTPLIWATGPQSAWRTVLLCCMVVALVLAAAGRFVATTRSDG